MKTLSQIEAMTDEQRIVATHELRGFKLIHYPLTLNDDGLEDRFSGPFDLWQDSQGNSDIGPPAYLTSLDAMHDARKHVPKELRNDYMDAIDEAVPLTEDTISQWNLLDASARDHNTAFLMTMMNDQPEKP